MFRPGDFVRIKIGGEWAPRVYGFVIQEKETRITVVARNDPRYSLDFFRQDVVHVVTTFGGPIDLSCR